MLQSSRLAVQFAFAIGLFCASSISFAAEPQAANAETTTDTIFRKGTPPDLLADIAQFDSNRSMASDEARKRIIDRGPAQVPAVLAALDDVVSNNGTSAQFYHLVTAFAVLGDASHADEFVVIARKINPRWMEALRIYDVLDAIGAADVADSLALDVLSNPDSEMAPLSGALSRYWFSAPADVAKQALQHVDNELLQIRSGVYRVAFVGGLIESVHDELIEDVSNVNQSEGGVVTMMNVMAAIEPEADFKARIEGLNLNHSVRKAALLVNEFVWQDTVQKEALLAKMLQSSVSELRSMAIAYILKSRRGDLLVHHRLAHVVKYDPFDVYREHILGFDDMPREKRLEHIPEDTLALLEAQAKRMGTVSIPWHTALVARRLGYSLIVADDGESIEIVR